MAVACFINGLLQKLKFLGYVNLQDLPTHFNWDLPVLLAIVKKQRPVIYPDSFWF